MSVFYDKDSCSHSEYIFNYVEMVSCLWIWLCIYPLGSGAVCLQRDSSHTLFWLAVFCDWCVVSGVDKQTACCCNLIAWHLVRKRRSCRADAFTHFSYLRASLSAAASHGIWKSLWTHSEASLDCSETCRCTCSPHSSRRRRQDSPYAPHTRCCAHTENVFSSSDHYKTHTTCNFTQLMQARTCRSSWRHRASSPASPSRWSRSDSSRWRNSVVVCPFLHDTTRFHSGSSHPFPSWHYRTHTPVSPSARESHLTNTKIFYMLSMWVHLKPHCI